MMMAATPQPLSTEPSPSKHGEGLATVALLSAAVRHHATAPLPSPHHHQSQSQCDCLPLPSSASSSSFASSSVGLLDGLLAHQPQLALAAERARAFLCALLTFPAVLAHLHSEEEDDKEEEVNEE